MRRYVDALLAYPRFLGVIKPALRGDSAVQLEARLASASRQLWPKKLRAPLGKRILAFSAHPDDESIGAGGLLLAHRRIASVSVLTVFNGDGGGALQSESLDARRDPIALVQARDREIRSACAVLGANYLGSLGFSDGTSAISVFSSLGKLATIVRQFAPDVVVMPSLFDGHPDHRLANLLWARACSDVRCVVLGSEIWTMLQPNAYFDISSTIEEKLALVGLFKTQTATVDYLGMVAALARVRGFFEGCGRHSFGAAEAYFSLPNQDYCALARVVCSDRGD